MMFDTKHQNRKQKLQNILRKSTQATCGIMEKEVSVPAKDVPKTIKTLKSAGFFIVGTSHGKTQSKKVWFIRAGGI